MAIRAKHSKPKSGDGLFFMFLPSFLGIILCAVCLMGSTYAWYMSTQTVPPQTLVTAHYAVEADLDGEPLESGQVLPAGEHTLTLKANGTASTGYCVLRFGTAEIQTKPIFQGETLVLSLVIHQPVALQITPQWGTSSSDEPKLPYDNGVPYEYGEPTPIVDPQPDTTTSSVSTTSSQTATTTHTTTATVTTTTLPETTVTTETTIATSATEETQPTV